MALGTAAGQSPSREAGRGRFESVAIHQVGDIFSSALSAAVNRVEVSTRFTPAVSIPVAKPSGSGPGGASTPGDRVRSSILAQLMPTARVVLSDGSDYVVAPWGEADGSYVGVVVLATIVLGSLALAFAAGRVSK